MAAASEATLVFTDIVDSTRLVEQLGDAAAADLWARHDRSVRDLLHRHRGREIDRTDGFFALFDRAADAAAFAAGCHDVAAELSLKARVALHTGAVTLRENDAADVARGAKPLEVEGLAKPFAARLNALAGPGQTLASAAACAACAGAAGTLRSHGHYRLKGVAEPAEVFELGHGDTPVFAPPGDTDKAYRVVRAADGIGGIWQPVREVPNNLPAERDAFIGRAAELDALAARLDARRAPGHRARPRRHRQDAVRAPLCARLARRLAGRRLLLRPERRAQRRRRARRGRARARRAAWPRRSADAAGPRDRRPRRLPRDPRQRRAGRWTTRRRRSSRWLDRAARRPLRRHQPRAAAARRREACCRSRRCRVDDDRRRDRAVHGAGPGAAARLRRRAPSSSARSASIVLLLDGMPLAIELAAARVRLLSPAQIVERLRDRFALLAGARGTVARQATLRAAIDWSWELLSPSEQAAFAQCAVFEGGFTLAAAEAVLDLARPAASLPTFDVVQALLDKSLLRVAHPPGPGGDAEPRFAMYVSLHEYARERLLAAGEAAAAEARHGRHFAAFGREDALAALWGSDGARRRARWRSSSTTSSSPAGARWRAATRRRPRRPTPPPGPCWRVQGPRGLGVTLGQASWQLLSLPPGPRVVVLRTYSTADASRRRSGAGRHRLARGAGPGAIGRRPSCRGGGPRWSGRHPLRPDALRRGATTSRRRARREPGGGRPDRRSQDAVPADGAGARPRAVGKRSTTLMDRRAGAGSRDRDPPPGAGAAEHARDARARDGAFPGGAGASIGACREIARETGHRSAEATSLTNLGGMLLDLGRDDEALPALQAALAIHREIGSRAHEGMVLGNLGILHQQQGRADDAREHFEAALAIAREVEDPRHELYVLGSLGELLLEQGKLAEAAACYRRRPRSARPAPTTSTRAACSPGWASCTGCRAAWTRPSRRSTEARRSCAITSTRSSC